MKKYLLSTLTAAAAMAVPAFADAELLGSWDFTSMNTGTTGSIASTTGNLTLSTGSSVASTSYGNSLSITSSSDQSHETTVDLSSLNISTDEGVSVVITITDLSSGSVTNAIWSAITTSDAEFAAAIGETSSGHSGNDRDAWFAANGTSGNIELSDDNETFTMHYPMEITMTYIGDTLTLYMDGEYIGSGTITNYSASTINGVAIASWDGNSDGNELSRLGISSLEIYKGDVMAAPEPSMFGLMFGLGAVGLVATRRRRRA